MDELEFETWALEVQPELTRFARARLDRETAEDVVSDTMVTLWVKSPAYPTDPDQARALRALAYRVLMGHISNEQRRQGRSVALVSRMARLRVTPDVVPDAHDRVAGQAGEEQLLARLPVADREVIALFLAGFSPEETAGILGCTVAAARKRRDRAKARLRAIVADERGTG